MSKNEPIRYWKVCWLRTLRNWVRGIYTETIERSQSIQANSKEFAEIGKGKIKIKGQSQKEGTKEEIIEGQRIKKGVEKRGR